MAESENIFDDFATFRMLLSQILLHAIVLFDNALGTESPRCVDTKDGPGSTRGEPFQIV